MSKKLSSVCKHADTQTPLSPSVFFLFYLLLFPPTPLYSMKPNKCTLCCSNVTGREGPSRNESSLRGTISDGLGELKFWCFTAINQQEGRVSFGQQPNPQTCIRKETLPHDKNMWLCRGRQIGLFWHLLVPRKDNQISNKTQRKKAYLLCLLLSFIYKCNTDSNNGTAPAGVGRRKLQQLIETLHPLRQR